jgi:hypothetical protein
MTNKYVVRHFLSSDFLASLSRASQPRANHKSGGILPSTIQPTPAKHVRLHLCTLEHLPNPIRDTNRPWCGAKNVGALLAAPSSESFEFGFVFALQPLNISRIKRRNQMLLLIIVLILLFGGGGGYYGYSRWGRGGGLGVVGTVLLIVLIVYLLGGMR